MDPLSAISTILAFKPIVESIYSHIKHLINADKFVVALIITLQQFKIEFECFAQQLSDSRFAKHVPEDHVQNVLQAAKADLDKLLLNLQKMTEPNEDGFEIRRFTSLLLKKDCETLRIHLEEHMKKLASLSCIASM